ncbi:MAG: hypothetical protein Q9160_007655 [Pyrenula sp. 1 TL-2023]
MAIKSKVISPTKLAHVGLRTSPDNFQPMIDFYVTFLGCEIQYQSDFAAFLTYDDEHHRVAIVAVPETTPAPPGSSGLNHMAFTFDNLKDLLQAYVARKERGITPIYCTNHGPTTSLYYRDPDGNRIETQIDNFDTPQEATAYMKSPEFVENPLGGQFDPEEVLRRFEAGEDLKALMTRDKYVGPMEIPQVLVA